MSIEVWGRKNSSNVMSVTWTLAELGVDYQRHNVGGSFGGTNVAPYSEMNPNATVPTINDNGLILWESNAVVRYLCSRYGDGSMWPADIAARAHADQWMDWAKQAFYPKFIPVFFGMIRTTPKQQDQLKIDTAVTATNQIMRILERHLADNDFMAGDRFSMGDVPLGPMMYRYFNLQIERASLPNVEAWYQRLCDRPAFRENVMLPFGRNLDEWNALETKGA